MQPTQSTHTKSRLTKTHKRQLINSASTLALANYFGDVTKTQAEEIFKVLALLAQFPGASPPEPLVGCTVIWTSQMLVGDSLTTQKFSVQVQYGKLLFNYSHPTGRSPIRGIQLPDSSHINFDNWDAHADRVEKQAITRLKK